MSISSDAALFQAVDGIPAALSCESTTIVPASSSNHVEQEKQEDLLQHHHHHHAPLLNQQHKKQHPSDHHQQQQQQHNLQLQLVPSQRHSSTSTSLHHHHHHQATDQKLAAVVAAAEVAASMYDAYQAWALKTYGDSAKTKTVTKKKYNRIMKILRGEESSSVENSKFRFWVKAKGFRIAPDSTLTSERSSSASREEVLYVPAVKPKTDMKQTGISSEELSLSCYKRVAVVENFYDIIYNVHVEMDGRSGKHAGQKRTYRAVAEMYAFLPREAVTRFLMSCSDCQKRMHLQYSSSSNNSVADQNGHQRNSEESHNVTSKSIPARISHQIMNNNSSGSRGMSPASSSNGDESDQGEEDQESSPFVSLTRHHYDVPHTDLVTECNTGENRIYAPGHVMNRKSGGASGAGSKKSLTAASQRITASVKTAAGSKIQNQGKKKGGGAGGRSVSASGKVTTGKSSKSQGGTACKKMRVSSRQQPQIIEEHESEFADERLDQDAVQWSEMLDDDVRDDLEGEEIEEEEMDVIDASGGRVEMITANESCQEKEEEGKDGSKEYGVWKEEADDEMEGEESQVKDQDDEEEEEEVRVVEEDEDEELDDDEIHQIRENMKTTSASSSRSSSPLDMRKAGDSNQSLRNIMKSLHSPSASCSFPHRLNVSSIITSPLENGSSGVKRNNCITTKKSPPSSTASPPSSATSPPSRPIDLSPDSKIKTRDQIVAAFSDLNGQRNIRSSSSSNHINYSAGSAAGYACSCSSNGNTGMQDEDDDDEDDEESEQIHGSTRDYEPNGAHDPERLKAFNIFVRLFVDENLDRMVPISRQPKEKIQMILDNCSREFPEFGERSRKRIRTYLKSCRRTRRQKIPATDSTTTTTTALSSSSTVASNAITTAPVTAAAAAAVRGGSAVLASAKEAAAAATTTPVVPKSTLVAAPITTCDSRSISMNGEAGSRVQHYTLNPTEIVAVKQLISGYRESAAFLFRSADELEQLLLRQA